MKVVFNKYGKNGTTFTITDSSSLENGRGIFAYANLTSFTSDLPNLTNGSCMFFWCENLTTFSADSSGSPVNLSKLTDGSFMFNHTNLKSFSSDLPSLTNGKYMFNACENLTEFNCNDLSSLKDGSYMFYGCSALGEFNTNLHNLENGDYMFYNCSSMRFDTKLSEDIFSFDSPKLKSGQYMFYNCKEMTGFGQEMPFLQNGDYMFFNCSGMGSLRTGTITSGGLISAPFGNLISGSRMFARCSSLRSSWYLNRDNVFFYINMYLDDLQDGSYMFWQCPNVTFSKGYSLTSLINGDHMFAECSQDWYTTAEQYKKTEHEYDFFYYRLGNLANGNYMFYNTPIQKIFFEQDMSNLKSGYYMFYGSQLTEGSVKRLKLALPNITGKNKENDADWKYTIKYTIEGQEYTKEYTIEKEHRGVIHIQVGKGSQDYYTDATVQHCDDIAKLKGWTVYLYNHDYSKSSIYSPST